MSVYIYGLLDPRFNLVRYINKSINPRNRYKDFINRNKILRVNSEKNAWLLELLNSGLNPVLVIIEKCTLENWVEREQYWINYYLAMPVALLVDKNQKRLIRNLDSRVKSSNANQGSYRKDEFSTSNYIGVSLKENGKWYVRINHLGKTISLGRFDNQIDAAIAYNKKATELYGEDARLNSI